MRGLSLGIVFDNLVGHPRQRPLQRRAVHEHRGAHDTKKTACLIEANGQIKLTCLSFRSLLASQCQLKGATNVFA